ncbi:MAG: LamG domain-containing protein [Chloroflexi bacterium]|nr:LamG domain-containing protein [Chloroflexota bacterium]
MGTASWTGADRAWGAIVVFVAGSAFPSNPYRDAVLADNPEAFYALNDIGTQGLTDLAGNHFGFYYDGYTLEAAGLVASSTDKAARFDGVNGRAEAPLQTQYTGDCSVSLWAKTSSPNQAEFAALIVGASDNAAGVFIICPDGAGTWKLHYRDTSAVGQNVALWAIPTDTPEWFGITIHSTDGAKIYRNVGGTVTLYTTVAASSLPAGRFAFYQIAKTQGAIYFNGTIDDVAIWHTALAITDFQDHVDAAAAVASYLPPNRDRRLIYLRI